MVRDIVGLYLAPPERALVLCVDEKPPIQAAQGTAPAFPMRPGQAERPTHDDRRHFEFLVLEAAQAGAALVLSDIPTFRELWDGAALFLEPDDAEGWAASLARLAAASGRAAELGERARARSARYSLEAMVERTLAVHRSVLRASLAAE